MYIGNFFKKINLEYKRHYFSGISFNSLTCRRDNIFFAIKGIEIDGNKYIDDAIKRGAKTIISNKKFEGKSKNESCPLLFFRYEVDFPSIFLYKLFGNKETKAEPCLSHHLKLLTI